MTPEKKRKLRNIALLALLGLIGGTFAFQSFNQQAINDREGQNNEGAAGSVHDYYNRETENKDVFVENYGDEPLLVRIQLKEFLSKNGESIVIDAERENLESWTVWQPSFIDGMRIHRVMLLSLIRTGHLVFQVRVSMKCLLEIWQYLEGLLICQLSIMIVVMSGLQQREMLLTM